MLTVDIRPPKHGRGHRIIRGHRKIHRQLPDGILPPRRATIKHLHDSALKKVLGKISAKYVLRAVVAKNSIGGSMDDSASLPWVSSRHGGEQ